jgi:hypothetical protein
VTMAVGGNEPLLDLLGHRKEVGGHAMLSRRSSDRRAGCHKPAARLRWHTVDHRGVESLCCAERQQIDIENVIHHTIVARIRPGRTMISAWIEPSAHGVSNRGAHSTMSDVSEANMTVTPHLRYGRRSARTRLWRS